MDIYAYAKETDYAADYYDYTSGRIYHIQDYGKALKNGLPTPGIAVSENGQIIGYAQEKNKEE